jgi:iron complex outermembrane receptor protein
MMRQPTLGLAVCLLAALSTTAVADDGAPVRVAVNSDLTELSLTDLANIKVTSVAKVAEKREDTPAAVQVLTSADLESSGAQTIPRLLRLAPGVHVAQASASQWAIGIRGFTSTLARDQLAVIDGRSLYSPLFAGTYWDVQNVFLEDVEQIEVVRGPGGTLWGPNAVNGIVDVVTRSAKDTPGGLAVLGGGPAYGGFGRLRYGSNLGQRGHYRVYGMYADHAAMAYPNGDDFDRWHMLQGGFRSDWDLSERDALTVQGDLYNGRAGQRTTLSTYEPPFSSIVEEKTRLGGGNLLSRWTRRVGQGQLSLQAYYDRTDRTEVTFSENRDTADLDVQYRLAPMGLHQLVIGAGYRLSSGRTSGVETVSFLPADRTDDLASAFIEDTVPLVRDRLRLSAGAKLLWNDYTGADVQPTARLTWAVAARHSLWAAVTRAVRTPSRVERDLALTVALAPGQPLFARVLGDEGFQNEKELAYEIGYRGQFSERVLVDVAAFYNRYPNLLSAEHDAPFGEPGRQIIPFRFANGLEGTVAGVEVWSHLRPAARWTIDATYSFLNMDLAAKAGSTDTTSAAAEDGTPRHMASVRSTLDLGRNVAVSGWYRWYGRFASPPTPAYGSLDVRASWRATPHLDIALVGQDLLRARHIEIGSMGSVGAAAVRRSAFAEVTCRF